MFLILICLFLVLYYILFRYKRRRLYELSAKLPDPVGLQWLGLLAYAFDGVDVAFPLLRQFSENAQKNLGMFKLWVGHKLYVLTIKSKDVEYILKKYVDKETLQCKIRDVVGNASIFGPVPIWARRRKLLIPGFTPRVINSFIDSVVDKSEDLTEQLCKDNRIGTGQFSVWPYVSAYTLSAVAETSLGVTIDAQKKLDMPFLKTLNITLFLMTKRLLSVWMWPSFLYKFTSTYREMEKCKAVLYNLTDEIIKERRDALKDFEKDDLDSACGDVKSEKQNKIKSFLDNLIIQSKEDKVADIEIKEEIMVLLFAGTGTSAVTISTTLKLMAKYPKIQDKVYAELMENFENSDRRLEKDDLNRLQYLDRVIKECLRLYPPVPIVGRKLYKETHLPSGMILPEGSEIIIPVWGVHRDPNSWGPTADCFDPDRFLSEDVGLLMPFSLGPRNCVAYKYALIAVKVALVAILRKYRVVGEEEAGPKPHINCKFVVLLKDKDDYQIGLEHR